MKKLQPSSVQAHENLAQLYRLSENRPAALETYQKLSEKRPHLHQIKRQIATLYSEMGDFKKATQFYEELIKANPMLYEQFSWELRYLYQRTGKGKELAQMEQKMADKVRDPYQVQNMAQRFQQDGEFEKAFLHSEFAKSAQQTKLEFTALGGIDMTELSQSLDRLAQIVGNLGAEQ